MPGLGMSNSATVTTKKRGGKRLKKLKFNKRSVDFDGTNDFMSMSTDPLSGESAGTIAFWSKTSSTGSQSVIGRHIMQWSISQNTTSVAIGVGNKSITKTGLTSDTGWAHWVITYNAGAVVIYKNGSSIHTGDLSAHATSFPSNSNSIFLGKRNHFIGQFYNGKIDEVAIWDEAIGADEVTAIYNSGKPFRLSQNKGDYDSSANLVNWWRMGDGTEKGSGTTVYDMEGSNNGTLTNGPTYSTDTP